MLPILYQKAAYIWFGTASVIIQLQEDRISFRLGEDKSLLPAKLLVLIISMFSKINEDAMHGRLKWKIYFDSCRIPYEVAKAKMLEPWFGENRNVPTIENKNIDLNSFFENF